MSIHYDQLDATVATRSTRRSVVKAGAKLAYAVPLVAASFHLTASGALALVCREGFELVERVTGDLCCRCDTVLGTLTIDDRSGAVVCVLGPDSEPAECEAGVQSVP